MASVISAADQTLDEKLEEKNEVAIVKFDDEEKSVKSIAALSEEKPEAEKVAIADQPEEEVLGKSGMINDNDKIEQQIPEEISTTVVPDVSEALKETDLDSNSPTNIEVNVKDLEDENSTPEEQKKEIAEEANPDVSEAPENKEENTSETGELAGEKESTPLSGSVAATPDIPEVILKAEKVLEGDDKLVNKKNVNNIGAVERALVINPTDLSVAEVYSDQGSLTLTETTGIVPKAIEVYYNEEEEDSASDERKSESLKGVDENSTEGHKNLSTAGESPKKIIEKNTKESSKNANEAPAETSIDFEPTEPVIEAVKGIESSGTVEEKKNVSEYQTMVDKNAQIPEDKHEETHQDEAVWIATDKSEQKELKPEEKESEKSKVADQVVSDTKLIKESTKRESTNILFKLKRSIVKVKKAILGKSPGSKTLSSETKDNN